MSLRAYKCVMKLSERSGKDEVAAVLFSWAGVEPGFPLLVEGNTVRCLLFFIARRSILAREVRWMELPRREQIVM